MDPSQEKTHVEQPNFGAASRSGDNLLPIYDAQISNLGNYDQQSGFIGKVRQTATERSARIKKCHNFGVRNSETASLLAAASENNRDKVQDILDRGVDPNISDNKKRTALHIAASKGHHQIVSLLLEYGADVNQVDSIGNTPLHLASCTSHLNVMTTLFNHGARLDITTQSKLHPLTLIKSKISIMQRTESIENHHLAQQLQQIVELMKSLLRRQIDRQETSTQNCGIDDISDQLNSVCSLNEVSDITKKLSVLTDGRS